jgi:hypothetical protein
VGVRSLLASQPIAPRPQIAFSFGSFLFVNLGNEKGTAKRKEHKQMGPGARSWSVAKLDEFKRSMGVYNLIDKWRYLAYDAFMSELTEEQEKTGRLFLRLPADSLAEISTYIARAGVTRSHFLAMSIMLGARALDRGLNPGQMFTPSMIAQMTEQMMGQFLSLNLEQLQKMFGAMPPEMGDAADVEVDRVLKK